MVLLALGGLGGGGYYLYASMAFREPRVQAETVWQEFDGDSNAANTKYKGKFVQVTGRVRIYTQNNRPRLFFEGPQEKPPWGIEVNLRPTQMQEVQDKQQVTVRGRFAQRKDKGNLTMSNCTLLKVHDS